VAPCAAVLPVGWADRHGGEKLLAPTGWQAPDADRYPTGAEWAEDYLRPLADVLGDRVRYGARVVGVARRGWDRVVDAAHGSEPLTVRVETAGGEERIIARAVIDASGTWGLPNPLGGDGLPALGEQAAADRIHYRVPDLTDPDVRARYAGMRIAVAGSGHSALTALVAFAELADEAPGTRVEWLLRRGEIGNTFGGGEADQLPARGALGRRAAEAVTAGHIRTVTGFRTAAVERDPVDDRAGRLVLESFDGVHLPPPVSPVSAASVVSVTKQAVARARAQQRQHRGGPMTASLTVGRPERSGRGRWPIDPDRYDTTPVLGDREGRHRRTRDRQPAPPGRHDPAARGWQQTRRLLRPLDDAGAAAPLTSHRRRAMLDWLMSPRHPEPRPARSASRRPRPCCRSWPSTRANSHELDATSQIPQNSGPLVPGALGPASTSPARGRAPGHRREEGRARRPDT
jgi:hypothetical protein